MEKDYFVPFADYGEDKFEEDKGDARDLLGRDTQLLRLHSP